MTFLRRVLTAMIVASLSPVVTGHEVIVHQALTRESANRSENFRAFLDDMQLTMIQYSPTHTAHARREGGTGFPDTGARSMLEAGSVLEDSGQRPLNHFYDPVRNIGLWGGYPRSVAWGYNGNAHSWRFAQDYIRHGVSEETEVKRWDGQELAFVSLGHVLHLLQDALQPSHTRDDQHLYPKSRFEMWGQQNISPDSWPPSVRLAFDLAQPTYFPDYFLYFGVHSVEDETSAAWFSNREFYSDNTFESHQTYPRPGSPDTSNPNITLTQIHPNLDIIRSTRLWDPFQSQLQALGFRTLVLLEDGTTRYRYSLEEAGRKEVLLDNAESLFPRAVELGRSLLNHFFRGRVSLSFRRTDSGELKLLVTNASSLSAIPNPGNLWFLDGKFNVYYDTVDGDRKHAFSEDVSSLAVGETFEMQRDLEEFFESKQDEDPERKLTVLYTGTIGEEAGFAAKSISHPDEVSLLLTFDVSGSISQDGLASAKRAGQAVMSLLHEGSGNRVSVGAFSSSAVTLVPFTDDLDAADQAIAGLTIGGSTALYDALVLGGESCSEEASAYSSDQDCRKVIMILFTDGAENSSDADRDQVIQALHRMQHEEISAVFLVYVAGDQRGLPDLEAIAAQTGREFRFAGDFADLAPTFLNAIESTCSN